MQNKPEKVKKTRDKSEEYIFKKSRWMKAKRAILWIILIYFFIRGISTTFRPDQTEEVTKIVEQFRADFGNYKDQDAEIMSFAQNFAKEYLTYKSKDEEEYKERIKQFVSNSFYNISSLMDLNGNAEAVYVQAYRKEEYSSSQYDVYVKADIDYTIQIISEDGETFNSSTERRECILKVPVYVSEGYYIVEDIPLFVNDDIKYSEYAAASYIAPEITDDDIKGTIETSLTSFLKAYYEQDQNVINYYLTKEADTNKFLGLKGRLLFDRIESLQCYQEEGLEYITCIVKIKVKDGVNGVMMYQQFNAVVIKNNDKYYVNDMDTKTNNFSINKTTEVEQ
jgi:hypothetical protein